MDRFPSAWVNGIGDEVVMFSTTMLGIGIAVLMLVLTFLARYYRRRHQMAAIQGGQVPPPGYNRDVCPICIGPHLLPVETNCGHLFCGLCLHEYYRHQHSFDMPCPLCRSKITLLFLCFPMLVDGSAELLTRQQEVYSFVDTYNRGCSGFPLSIWQMILDWPTTMRHFWYDLPIVAIVRFLARARMFFYIIITLLYILSPLDVFPEALMGIIGYIDDLIIFAVLAIHVSIAYRRLVVDEGPANGARRF